MSGDGTYLRIEHLHLTSYLDEQWLGASSVETTTGQFVIILS